MPTAATEKAGWWSRALALLIDCLVLAVADGIITTAAYGGDIEGAFGLEVVIAVAYFVYSWSAYGKGQTIGMRTMNITVTKIDGSALDLIDAFIRTVALGVSLACVLVGVIWAAFDSHKQGWHDKIARTYVVSAPSSVTAPSATSAGRHP
jgi:uncharacterized RDD family membrane protein YckC